MNLEKMFKLQEAFDKRVVMEKGLESEYLFLKKKTALLVEIGELANELPSVFKFWSNKKDNFEKALVEYVDGLHFVLSLIIDAVEGDESIIEDVIIYEIERIVLKPNALILEFNWLYKNVSLIHPGEDDTRFAHLLYRYLSLGHSIGFTDDQIEQAYLEKNKINHVRQETGY
jgi:dimeric dUTPase (all-alpha-NTP-PPase superfamily)